MSKMSEPMKITQIILNRALEKAGGNFTILSEQLNESYARTRNLYSNKRIPAESVMLKLEKFLKDNKYKPRQSHLGRPKN